ncbi:MAG: hypothetical protein IJU18_02555 [Oscillospiraceae bacterium]|nr:hypothetical protein [Oscillospiraceae bacterium]
MKMVSFSDISERDMDMLFIEEFMCSEPFLRLFTDLVGIPAANVLSGYLSKTDPFLGESDITVIVESHGEKVGLLIEDKIDAIAMPEQAARYSLRGQKGIELGDYSQFFVFIIAPENYLLRNTEAQKYPNKVTYEAVLSYFEHINDPRSWFKIQQIKQAIDKQKKGYQVEIDESVTNFWHKYSAYQKTHYPDTLFVYSGEGKGANATWPRFNTVINGLYIYHKTEAGFVDMTFDGCADRVMDIEKLLSAAMGDFIGKGYTVQRTGKAAAIRLIVPALNLHSRFEDQIENVEKSLDAVNKLSEFAKLLDYRVVRALLRKQQDN